MNPTAFRRTLRTWFDRNRRDLPWRRNRSLYRTVVSEFMLQQTRVDTVLPYFERWTRELPDFPSLAAASEDRILKLWEGLGYYSRARNLHALAKLIAGMQPVPTDTGSWMTFPGIGPYSAAAITSISFSTPAACVDGNVVRILARITGDKTPYSSSGEAVKKFRLLADSLLDRSDPGRHNEAMMELGATVCHRRKPACLLCPVKDVCHAHATGRPEEFPRLRSKAIEKRSVTRVWCMDSNGRLLLHRIGPEAKRLAGMWELPTAEQIGLPSAQFGNRATLLLRVKRSITRYSITESIFDVSLSEKEVAKTESATHLYWKSPDEITHLPFSGPHRRWVDKLLKSYTPS